MEVPGYGRRTQTVGINDSGVIAGNDASENFLRFP
jgi:hypothetical protein